MSSRCRVVLGSFLVSALLVAGPAGAQGQGGQVGIGIGISSSFFGEFQGQLAPTLYVPIALTDRITIEPELGYTRFSEEDDEFEDTFSLLTLGAGLLFEIGDSQNGRIYAGPRLGIVRVSNSTEGPDFESDDSTTNLMLGGILGGEFFLQPQFSLGADVGFEWLDLEDDDSEDDGSLLSTVAEFRVRWYFL